MSQIKEDRRFVIKALAVGSISFVTYGSCSYLSQQETDGFDQLLSKVRINQNLSPIKDMFPDPVNMLNQHLQVSKTISYKALKIAIKQAIKKDFNQGDTIVFEKWYLSKTEALIIASSLTVMEDVVVQEELVKTYENAPFENFVEVKNWGPKTTTQGVKFNEQPDGHCGIWVVADNISDALQVYVGDTKTNVFPNEKGFTTGIYKNIDEFINKIGTTQIIVYDMLKHRKQVIGEFEVFPPLEFHQYEDKSMSKVFSPITKWGPKKARLGEVFNEQPNGHAAFWVRGSSNSNDVKFLFNDIEHPTTVRKGVMTANVSPLDLPSKEGKYPVYLLHHGYSEKLLVGYMKIQAK